MEYCGDYQGVVGGIYMQCRGEWKLARVASGVSAMRVQIMVCIPGRDDLICSRGLNAVIPTENMHRACGFRKESS